VFQPSSAIFLATKPPPPIPSPASPRRLLLAARPLLLRRPSFWTSRSRQFPPTAIIAASSPTCRDHLLPTPRPRRDPSTSDSVDSHPARTSPAAARTATAPRRRRSDALDPAEARRRRQARQNHPRRAARRTRHAEDQATLAETNWLKDWIVRLRFQYSLLRRFAFRLQRRLLPPARSPARCLPPNNPSPSAAPTPIS
jgi:hypothetical protein